MPNDGGNLVVEPDQYESVASDPIAEKYLRRFVMGKEFIHSLARWCLWLVDLNPADVARSNILRERITQVRKMREASKRKATRKLAATPHLFGEIRQPQTSYLGLPRIFSETRAFATCERLPVDVIAADSVFTCPDPDGYAFAIASSSMFITWQKTVGGRLESRLRFSNTVVWNNLPLPPVTEDLRQQIIEAGEGVLAARELHPERSLADHYNPLAMDPALLKAHAALDKVVDKAFGAVKTLRSNEERLQVLFERYAEMTH
jgi:hypothetical protein